ncbi:Hypothetical protein PENO1_035570 [Penicillium occitanis (nom. inval.)]|nr:Hypothetical protein PENO1_035570 [Penicillium occitanis (nom. inval.)]PCH06718.1 hypothetical protein PENOC_022250 [Penicillium occitanis (nom. inval.)]
MNSHKIPDGHLGNLTKEQEVKLREMWTVLFKLFGIKFEGGQLEKAPTNPPESPDSKKKSKRGFFGFGGAKKEEPATPDVGGLTLSDHDDKYGQNKEFKQAVADLTPEQLRDSLWSMLKADHPDALLLRFLRARKWDVNKAVVMLVSTMRWRLVEMHVDDDIMQGGEAKAIEQSESSDHDAKKLASDFMAQTRMGKSFITGIDKQGRPICLIRVKMHKIGVHSEKSTERYTVHMIETARLMLPRPIETAVILFDMTDFSLANMDYAPVKFIIKCFEANYPESLGAVLIHQAPWIFSGIWKIIKGWLDPVVAAKVHFTNTTEDLEEFIDRSRILKEFGGEDDATFEYIEAQPGENDAMKDTVKREEVLAKHKALSQELQDATKHWIEAANKNDEAAVESWKAKREELAQQYSKHYWITDPYIRARSVYDRNGVILGGGKIKFYPEQELKDTTAADPTTAETEEKKIKTNGTAPDSAIEIEEKAEITVTPEVNGVEAAAPAVAVSAN